MTTPTKRRVKTSAGHKARVQRERLSIVKPEYRDQYKENGFTNGDAVAVALKQENITLEQVAIDNALDLGHWEHLNSGQQRMCLGNRLRGMVRHGSAVKIGQETINRI